MRLEVRRLGVELGAVGEAALVHAQAVVAAAAAAATAAAAAAAAAALAAAAARVGVLAPPTRLPRRSGLRVGGDGGGGGGDGDRLAALVHLAVLVRFLVPVPGLGLVPQVPVHLNEILKGK